MKVFYSRTRDVVLFIRADLALENGRIWLAMYKAKTWRDFLPAVPLDDHDVALGETEMDVLHVIVGVFCLGLWVYTGEQIRIRKETEWLAARGLPMWCGKTNNCRLAGGCKACYQRLLPKPKLGWPTYIR